MIRRWNYASIVQALSLGGILIVLAACAGTSFEDASNSIGDSRSKIGQYKIGTPYQIDNVWYYPKEDYAHREEGIASWYGPGFHGKSTANGEKFNQNAVTAAHRTLPMPSLVRVTNLENGRSLVVRINDRGPYAKDRVIDMSQRSAHLLGFAEKGTARVRVEILPEESRALKERAIAAGESPDNAAAPQDAPVSVRSGAWIQAGAFANRGNAEKVQAQLRTVYTTRVTPVAVNGKTIYRVRLGPLRDADEAEGLLSDIRSRGYSKAIIVWD